MPWQLYLVEMDRSDIMTTYQDIFGRKYQDYLVKSVSLLLLGKQTIDLPENVRLAVTINDDSYTLHIDQCRYSSSDANIDILAPDNQFTIQEWFEDGFDAITFHALMKSGKFIGNTSIVIGLLGAENSEYRLCWWDTKYGDSPPTQPLSP